MPTVLIADDDPVSLRFLQAAIGNLGCAAALAATGAEALEFAGDDIALALLDLNMPDIGGSTLLDALRARGMRAPAIATSAAFDTDTPAMLHAAGFIDTLAKPATLASIEEVLRRHLPARSPTRHAQDLGKADDGTEALLDDAGALAAIGGDHDALRALRRLFDEELQALQEDLRGTTTQAPALSDRLHRLRASSGFCGAPALSAAALRLQSALGGEHARAAMTDFVEVCGATRRALAAHG